MRNTSAWAATSTFCTSRRWRHQSRSIRKEAQKRQERSTYIKRHRIEDGARSGSTMSRVSVLYVRIVSSLGYVWPWFKSVSL
jgi:hypothetical protein